MIVEKFAIFHKYWDGDFPCYGPEDAIFDTVEQADKALLTGTYDDGYFQPVITIVRVKED